MKEISKLYQISKRLKEWYWISNKICWKNALFCIKNSGQYLTSLFQKKRILNINRKALLKVIYTKL